MFDKLLIANRGEIACRIQRTARRLGVATVAVYSDADAEALHVRAADEAVRIGPAAARDSYLRGDALIAAALKSGAQAIHPGYGFLSENAPFAADCAQAGLVFVGPPPAAIRAMASKSAAKALMQETGVPLVPGYHGEDQSPALLQREADRIGYPVLIKASAGGGGKGMRRVDGAADFAAALASCQREASASFADARVLVEKYLLQPRHIEIQVFTDTHGNGVYLFERDCSVQRRHQKVLEEAPAPGMEPKRRARMGAAALAAAKAVGYVGAGTVEFIAEPGGQFFFMEMNTRLQVEHPVTEMITGLDLVEWQLRVASGEALPLRQKDLSINGHAIEARIYAEDPERGFLPATGRLVHFRTPAATPIVRIDSGVEQGDLITPYYDPMIAKLIVWGESRELARGELLKALGQFQIVGLSNNVQFLARLVATPAFATADLDTALIEREQARLFGAAPPVPDEALIAASLRLVAQQTAAAHAGPGLEVWRHADSWRLNAPAARSFHFRAAGADRHLIVRPTDAGYELKLDARTLALQCLPLSATDARLTLDGNSFDATSLVRDGRCDVFLQGVHHQFEYLDPLAHVGEESVAEGHIRAIMPGRVVALLVQPGTRVARGEPLLILEAMKMEHTLGAPADGICEAFNVAVGEQVAEGTELVQFTPSLPAPA
ncbi:MAG TPA: acetyl/propionyl/methylcrotonyl-CoA carboxylase subunit alpha [Steroidobacteraceae bacterium]|nr:acetyl/propionyl/methylcrotonyl-CoA carboxylase subunit alpha [Steroidobacteraceae bacterium]